MARKLEVIITGDASALEKAFGKAGDQASSFEKGIGKASKVATVGLAAMAAGGYKLAQSAAAQAEAQNKTNEVFGKSAGAMEKWSSTTANAMGISKTASLQASSGFGALFTNIGEGEAKAAGFARQMVTAAGDLASFHDALPTEALEAMTSALAGEFEPLRQFQIFLSAAKIEAEALRLGLIRQGEAMTDNARVIATRSLVLGNLGKAEGDMQRTMDSASNSAKRSQAVGEDLAASQGNVLLPAYTAVTGALRALAGVTESHTGATQIAVGILGGLAVAVLAVSAAMKVATATAWLFSASTTAAGVSSRAYMVVAGLARAATLAWTAAQWLLNAALVANPIGVVVIAIAALAIGLVLAYQKSETFRTVVHAAFEAVKLVVGTVIKAILGYIDLWLAGFQLIAKAASHLPGVGKHFDGVADKIGAARTKIDELQAAINRLQGKDVQINIRTVYTQSGTIQGSQPGPRAQGGPVSGGGAYVVGEKGPELFVPGRSGTIIPNAGMSPAMAGGGIVNNYFNFPHFVGSRREIVDTIRTELDRTARRN